MDEVTQNRMLGQMLDITQRRIDRQRTAVRNASHIHDTAVQRCTQALGKMEDVKAQAPVRRKEHLSELMSGAGYASGQGAWLKRYASSPLDAYSKQIEVVAREVAESVNQYEEADRNRAQKLQDVQQAQSDLRDAVVRREKWLALQDEFTQQSNRSFEG